jgi:serine/threonine-protein kinase
MSTLDTAARELLFDRLRSATRGEYELLSELGRGGMAIVFLARDLALGRRVALKVMLPHLAAVDGMAQRFLLEASTAAQLEHAHIAPVYAAQQRDGLLFFAMKFIDGVSLEQMMRRVGPLPIPIARLVLTHLAEALQYAHDHGVTHRDVKPANVMIDSRGNALLTDFGIARVADTPRLTQQGLVIGTPAYMSPEQMRGESAGAAADQYALGVLAYEMLTGAPPFTGSTTELATAHLSQAPKPLAAVRRDCPSALAGTVMRMLEKNASARWPSLDAVAEQLLTDAPRQTTGWRRQMVTLLTTAIPRDAATSMTANPDGASSPASAARSLSEATRPARPWWTRPSVRAGLLGPLIGMALFAGLSGSGSAELTRCPAATKSDRTCADSTPPHHPDTTRLPRVDSVRFALDRDSVRLTAGDTLTVRAKAAMGDSSRGQIVWSSDRPWVVSVSPAGTLTARGPGGPVTLIAIRGTDTATARVWVDPEPVASIRLDVRPRTVRVGDFLRLNARALGPRGTLLPNVRVRITPQDTTVVAITAAGVLVARAPGTTTVTFTAGDVETQVSITVAAPPPVPALGSAQVVADLAGFIAAVGARDTSWMGRVTPDGGGARWLRFQRWVMEARDPSARLAGPVNPAMTGVTSGRVEFTVVVHWKTRLRRQVMYVAFVADYVFRDGWHLTSIRPAGALP